jgi:3-hydroxymyristoyl/3-hydroxydecanoyl-(acyl carrier protein) dehydratase
MLEMAAQSAAVGAKLFGNIDGFIGFGGIDDCKFRDTVTPPCTLYVLAVGSEIRPRRIIAQTQGVIAGRIVFEARITGLVLR